MNALCDIGLVGLGVMGRSLALNMASRGFRVGVYNYIPEVTEQFLAGEGPSAGGSAFVGAFSLSVIFHGLYNLLVSVPGVSSYIGFCLPILAAIAIYHPYHRLRMQKE